MLNLIKDYLEGIMLFHVDRQRMMRLTASFHSCFVNAPKKIKCNCWMLFINSSTIKKNF